MSKLFMMVGLPASGKSTIAKKISQKEDAIIVSSDEIRKELFGDENSQQDNTKVFETVHKRIIDNLKENKNVIFDATNISYKKRMSFLQKSNKLNVEKIAVMVATPYEECLERNKHRERVVPEEVIKRMYYNFYVPQYFEGFDDIQIKYDGNTIRDAFTIDELQDENQDNPHHRLSVKDHCSETYSKLVSKKAKDVVLCAGLIHDIGKLKTKTFVNSKGETTDIAHFYNHEKVGAYDSLFWAIVKVKNLFGYKEEGLEITKLIQWHMLPWMNLQGKTVEKYKKLLGEEFWNDLMLLHEADKEAH